MVNYKLYYFNATGLAEPIRYLLHYCEVEFEDIRFNNFEEWKIKYKKEMPMEQLPVLEINGVKYHQHKSICRYIARKFNLCGSNEEEALRIDALVDDIDDIRIEIGNYFKEENFVFKIKIKEKILEKLPFLLNKFESHITKNGFFFNSKISWADIYYSGICEIISNILEQDINENYYNLKKLINNIRSHKKIKTYIENRPIAYI